MGIGCVSVTVHESLSYSDGIMPDYGAKQRAVSVSLLVLGEDAGWTGHTAVPSCSALDTQASSKTACVGVHVFVSALIFVLLECMFLFGLLFVKRVCLNGNDPLITIFTPFIPHSVMRDSPTVMW